ncbi:hypothetical protein [Blastococcus sp. PRF04-17]|uniref:hypothetical protein n=1 Tax=Blastococcus sp. PRF04-17 TaxID=2933797 RepID=UPI001FF52805|nr:hypothetical protein [Blastococcus sp. PRF04-17]UOX99913.1 hypothetical protein MVA48_12815 [Blastococcus sp. PRF04-17]
MGGGRPPRELTGGWPAVRLDEPHPPTQQFEQVRVERSTARPPVPAPEPGRWDAPSTAAFGSVAPPPAFVPPSVAAYRPPPVPPAQPEEPASEPRLWSSTEQPPATSAFPLSVPPPVDRPPEEPPSPLEWLAARSLLDPAAASPRRRRGDDEGPVPEAAGATTTQRPVVPAGPPPVRIDDRGGYRVAVRDEPAADGRPGPGQEKRLDQILAENGVAPTAGGRRRRRYRDEDEPDDVLARVLGRG